MLNPPASAADQPCRASNAAYAKSNAIGAPPSAIAVRVLARLMLVPTVTMQREVFPLVDAATSRAHRNGVLGLLMAGQARG